ANNAADSVEQAEQGVAVNVELVSADRVLPRGLEQVVLAEAGDVAVGVEVPRLLHRQEPLPRVPQELDDLRAEDGPAGDRPTCPVAGSVLGLVALNAVQVVRQDPAGDDLVAGGRDAGQV